MAMIYDLDNENGGTIFRDDNTIPAITVGGTVNGAATIAPFKIAGQSQASAALIGFGGGFVSLTSVVLTTVSNFDYAIPIEVNGVPRYIPVLKAAGLVGAAKF